MGLARYYRPKSDIPEPKPLPVVLEQTGFLNKRFSWVRSLFILLVALILGVLVLFQLLHPYLLRLSDRYLARGDSYLVLQDYGSALNEYDKALEYNPNNTLVKSHQILAKLAPTDPAVARNFYRSKGAKAVNEQLDAALKDFPSALEALKAGLVFYDRGEFALAQYPLQKAVKLDPEYPEAWNYLGLTYQKLASLDHNLEKKALEAFKKRDELTPNYIIKIP